jgi:hypothetical protein
MVSAGIVMMVLQNMYTADIRDAADDLPGEQCNLATLSIPLRNSHHDPCLPSFK